MRGKSAAAGAPLDTFPCPKTGAPMGALLTPCYPIRSMASAWLEANPRYEQ